MLNRKSSVPETIKRQFGDKCILPDDPRYGAARTLFMGGIDKRPAAIVRAANADDVAAVVACARDHGIELAIRSGGHSGAGHGSSDGGVVLDLRDMNAIDIDAPARTAWAGTGATAGAFTRAAGAHGLAVGFGDTGSVGIGGITVGGGVGYLVRKHGLTIDSVVAAEVVTADGRLVSTDATSEPDLFWAIRGGGGNFGVVTRVKFRLHDLSAFTGGMLALPATADTIARFIAAAHAAPEAMSTIANVMPAPPMPFLRPEHHGQLIVMGLMGFAGPDEEAAAAFRPFREIAEPLADMVRPMPYAEMFPPEDPNYRPTAVAKTMFMDSVGLEEARLIVDHLGRSQAAMRVAQLRMLGGAAARVANDATAYAHRNSAIMVNVAAFYTTPEDRIVQDRWVAGFSGALHQDDGGAYVNFLGEEPVERVRAAYPGETWERLRRIKRRYDPDNLFRLNQNIPPAA